MKTIFTKHALQRIKDVGISFEDANMYIAYSKRINDPKRISYLSRFNKRNNTNIRYYQYAANIFVVSFSRKIRIVITVYDDVFLRQNENSTGR